MPERGQDPLGAVREHLDEAHAAADRLVREAQRQAEQASGEGAARVPPRGWDSGRGDAAVPDLAALAALLDGLRHAVPAELSRQLAAALREMLLAVRALLDWYIERLDGAGGERPQVEVEDIPLD